MEEEEFTKVVDGVVWTSSLGMSSYDRVMAHSLAVDKIEELGEGKVAVTVDKEDETGLYRVWWSVDTKTQFKPAKKLKWFGR